MSETLETPNADATRPPKVRQALILHVPTDGRRGAGKITVTEGDTRVRLALREPYSLGEGELDLTLAEARQLAEHLTRAARAVAHRPADRP